MSATPACRVCEAPLGGPVYRSEHDRSLTSLCTLVEQAIEVHACGRCGHVQTSPLSDLDRYYSEVYTILVASDEEDQLYNIENGAPTFRAEHQARTLVESVTLAEGARVLDYGAAKGATLRRICVDRPDVDLHLFDVSDMYRPFWDGAVAPDRQATFDVPSHWHESFDLVVSFFVLEHLTDPSSTVAAVRDLLREGGQYYFLVPNFDVNIADLIVADHVSHFSRPSIEVLLERSGFQVEMIDAELHTGAWVVLARKGEVRPIAMQDIPDAREARAIVDRAAALAEHWTDIVNRIKDLGQSLAGEPTAIYGAGFYGSLIFTSLGATDDILGFVDQNPFLAGRTHLDRPVFGPDDLPAATRHICVGLNPAAARAAMASIDTWRGRALEFHYLDGDQ